MSWRCVFGRVRVSLWCSLDYRKRGATPFPARGLMSGCDSCSTKIFHGGHDSGQEVGQERSFIAFRSSKRPFSRGSLDAHLPTSNNIIIIQTVSSQPLHGIALAPSSLINIIIIIKRASPITHTKAIHSSIPATHKSNERPRLATTSTMDLPLLLSIRDAAAAIFKEMTNATNSTSNSTSDSTSISPVRGHPRPQKNKLCEKIPKSCISV